MSPHTRLLVALLLLGSLNLASCSKHHAYEGYTVHVIFSNHLVSCRAGCSGIDSI